MSATKKVALPDVKATTNEVKTQYSRIENAKRKTMRRGRIDPETRDAGMANGSR
jgi:hypothetical protein